MTENLPVMGSVASIGPQPVSPFSVGGTVSESVESEGLLVRLFRRIWGWLLLIAVASGFGAFQWAKAKAVQNHEIESRMSFHRTSFGAPLYLGPDVHTLAAEFESYSCLEDLRERAGLRFPAQLIAQRLNTSVTRGNGSVDVAFTWENPDDGKMILGELLEVGIERCRKIRDEEIDQHIEALTHTTESVYLAQLEEVSQQYAKLSMQYGVADIADAAEDIEQQIKALSEELRRERFDRVSITEHLNALRSKPLTLVSFEATSDYGDEDAYRALKRDPFSDFRGTRAEPSWTQNSNKMLATVLPSTTSDLTTTDEPSRMMERMEDLKQTIEQERSQAMAEAKLRSQEDELERVRALVEKRLTPKSRYTSLLAEVEQLRIAVVGNAPVQNLKAELDDLESKMEAYGPDASLAAESAKELARLEGDLQRQMITIESRIAQLQAMIDAKQPELKVFETALPEANKILAHKDLLEERVKQHLALAEGLQNLKRTDANAFSVTTPPVVNVSRQSSTWRKQFAIAFLALFVGLSFPVSAIGLKTVLPSPVVVLSRKLRIPVLASLSSGDRQGLKSELVAEPLPSIQLLAFHLQQLLKTNHAVLHFAALGPLDSTNRLVEGLARSFVGMGQEASLIRLNATGDTSFEGGVEDPDRVEADRQGNDDGNQVATRLRKFVIHDNDLKVVQSLLDSGQARGVVFVTGLGLDDRATVEMLSLRSNGVVFCSLGNEKVSAMAEEVMGSLIRYQAPILGLIN